MARWTTARGCGLGLLIARMLTTPTLGGVLDDRPAGGTFVFVNPGTPAALVANNIFAGSGTPVVGPATISHNIVTDDPPVDAVEESGGVIVSYREDGEPVSVEFLNASTRQLVQPGEVSVTIQAESGAAGPRLES